MLLLLIASCDKGGRVTSAGGPLSTSAPQIESASCYPEKPTAETRIIAQYTLRDAMSDGVAFTFKWYVDNSLVQEGESGALDPGKYRKGSEVYVEIIPAGRQGSGSPFRTKPVMIDNLPPSVASISFMPDNPQAGSLITATAVGTDPDGDNVAFSYQWFANGVAASEIRKSNEFNTSGLKKKDQVAVVVTPADDAGAGKPLQSDILVLVNSAPKITSTPPTSISNSVYTYQVTATDPDGDKLSYGLLTAPAGMQINSSTGLIQWGLPAQVTEKQEIPVKIRVDDGDGGSITQGYSLFLEMK